MGVSVRRLDKLDSCTSVLQCVDQVDRHDFFKPPDTSLITVLLRPSAWFPSTMTNFTFDYASLSKILEGQELESPAGQTSPQVYGQLLAIYLLFNDLTSAKFLWKRIPESIKMENDELSVIWSVGKLLWKKNYSEIHRTIDSIPVWPNHLKNIMKLISDSTRQRVIELISKAYSTISLDDASNLLGLSREETLLLASQRNWVHEADGFLTINQQLSEPRTALTSPVLGLELLDKLSEYITFLETAK